MGRLISWVALVAVCFGVSSCGDDDPISPSPIDSQIVWAVGNDELLDGQMFEPADIVLDPTTGNLYVLDQNFLHAFSQQGVFLERTEIAGITRQVDLAITPSGTILMVDGYHDRVLEMTKSGETIRAWGSSGTAPGEFIYPSGLALGDQGRIYVADTGNFRIQVFDSEGVFIKSWFVGYAEGQLPFPSSIVIDAAGMVYVGDSRNDRILKFDADGSWIAEWGSQGTGPGEFSESFVLGISETGDVLALERAHRVQRFSPHGLYVSSWEGEGDPNAVRGLGIAVSEAGTVYTLGLKNFGVQAYGADGQLMNQFGTLYYSGPEQFRFSHTVSAAPDGSVFIGQSFLEGRVQRLDDNGEYLGEWTYTKKDYLVDLAVGADGFVYVLGVDSEDGEAVVDQYSATGEEIGHSWSVPQQSRSLNIDDQDRVWIIDYAATRVLAYEASGDLFASWGELGEDPGELLKPVSLAVQGGKVVVCDKNSIDLFSETGTFKKTITSWDEGTNGFEVIALNDEGLVFATRRYADSVSIFDLSGAPRGELEFDASWFDDLGTGPQGTLFLLTESPSKVVKFLAQ